MREGEACIRGAEAKKGAALVGVEGTFGPGDGGQCYRHHPFQDVGDGFEQYYNVKGGRGVIGGLSRLVQDHPVGDFQCGGVVPKSH